MVLAHLSCVSSESQNPSVKGMLLDIGYLSEKMWERKIGRTMAGIALSGVSKRFGAVEVIRDVSLDIESGELVVFLGPSGSGKTTLLRMIAGLESIDKGTLTIDGVRSENLRAGQAQRRDGLPELCALPAYDGRREHGVWAAEHSASRRMSSANGSPKRRACWRWKRCWTGGRRSSPAGNASALPSGARSSRSPRRSCSTSRFPISMPRFVPARASNSPNFISA